MSVKSEATVPLKRPAAPSCDRPVGIISAQRCVDLEACGQLGEQANLFCPVERLPNRLLDSLGVHADIRNLNCG
ncbi:hypothetical protein NVSP9465_02688 [Novosphingobium sp. CECT 9465]|nr:hypothetical protein NVSP9465_02688 [Novosphingobium sp. CECT 9465]